VGVERRDAKRQWLISSQMLKNDTGVRTEWTKRVIDFDL
jgi:hypothetical protein